MVIILILFLINILLIFFIIDHILPIALGHQCCAESYESWKWFLDAIKKKFPTFAEGTLIMDRDKGGEAGAR